MGSKLILILGLLAGGFLAYTCVKDNKDKLISKHDELAKSSVVVKNIENEPEVATKPEIKKPEIKVEPLPIIVENKIEEEPVAKLEEPKFLYSLKDGAKLTVKLSTNDKTEVFEKFILGYCQSDICKQDLTFKESVKDALWQDDVLKIAEYLKDKNVKNSSISINGYNLQLEGEFASKEDKKVLSSLLEPYSLEIFKIKNLTTIKKKIIIEEVKEITNEITKKTQNEINRLLKINPIYFRYNSDNLTLNANAILTKIIDTLKDVDDISLRVEGHTDSGGDAVYNKTLSQKRAEAVKTFLLQNELQHLQIEAKGYGEERPITENSKNTANRRVEIYLIKGE